MSEFNLIKQHFTRPTRYTNLGVGDDAALISISPGMELAISADMLVADTHFFADANPYHIGWKSLAVNLSDMAAMGAKPKWATLAIALPNNDTQWLNEFSRGFFACAAEFDVDLIGGDTTHGPLNICVQMMGEVPSGKAIKRSGAKASDDIWVSGLLGNAALALAHMQKKITLTAQAFSACAPALHRPQARVTLGLALHGIANSAIDISDGLLADLGHILRASNVGATLQLSQIPHSEYCDISTLQNKEIIKLLLAGGDDYELCFTAPTEKRAEILALSQKLALSLSCIGQITNETGVVVHGLNDEILDIKETGFDHFN